MARMWVVRLEVPIEFIMVEVEYEADRRFLFNIGDVPSHWKRLGYHITVESTAPEEEVMRVLDLAHSQSHMRGDLEHASDIERTVTINTPQKTN